MEIEKLSESESENEFHFSEFNSDGSSIENEEDQTSN
jgi:hypothetical protein